MALLKTGGFAGYVYDAETGTGLNQVTAGINITGTTQGAAWVLDAQSNQVLTCVLGGTAVLPPIKQLNCTLLIANQGANPVLVYASGIDTINALAQNASFSVPAAKSCIFNSMTVPVPNTGGVWSTVLSA